MLSGSSCPANSQTGSCVTDLASDLLAPRDEQISVYEIHSTLYQDPLGPGKNKYLNLLAETLLGVHDSAREVEPEGGRPNRDFSVDRHQLRWAMQLSLYSVTGIRHAKFWEEEPILTP